MNDYSGVVWCGVVWEKGRKERAGRKDGWEKVWKEGGKEGKGRMEEGIKGEEGWENWE